MIEGVAEVSQKAKEYSALEKKGSITFEPKSDFEKFEIKDQNQLLKTTDILILHQDLVRLGFVKQEPKTISSAPILIEAKSAENEAQKLPDPTNPKKRSNQLTELLERILIANPKISAKAAWRVLEDEVSKDIDERLYDVDAILKDVSNTEIAWQSRYGNSSITKLSTFDGAVSRVRKRISA